MITIKDMKDEDFVQYKVPAMTISFPYCTFKCGRDICQNTGLVNTPNHQIQESYLATRYIQNKLTKAIVFSGLEPFDSFEDMLKMIDAFRYLTKDPIVIYSGYTEDEIQDKLIILKPYGNLIIKYGRYRPDLPPRFDEVLGVQLVSNNQYAREYK